jgi:hypothetical protein
MVVLSDKYNFIYIVNPKTGSTSLRNILLNTLKQTNSCILQDCFKNEIKYDIYHNNTVLTKDMCIKLNKNYNDYFSFTTIRNPWAKMVSLYFYAKPDKNLYEQFDEQYDKSTSFYYNFNEWLKNKHIIGHYWYKIESWAFENSSQSVNKIYNIETFSIKQLFEDMLQHNIEKGYVLNEKDYEFCIELPMENSTTHEHYSKYYNDESIEIIRKIFAKDIEIGNYEFEREI